MTNKQIAWAAQHDWFDYACDGTVYATEYVSSGYDAWIGIPVSFTNFMALRNWAGY